MPQESQKLAVVTGASTGIGRAAARALNAHGWRVLGGVRSDDAAAELEAEGIEPVTLDVTDPAHVSAVAERVDADGASLGALVNNAGIAVNAPVESLPMEEWRRQFEVNFFGQVAVTQALLPALLRSGGRIVNVSSIGGRVAGPTFGAYAGAKFALEGMSDALRREVGRLGVRVIVIEPGAVATPIWGKGIDTAQGLMNGMTAEVRDRYGKLIEAMLGQGRDAERNGIDPAEAGKVIADAVEARRPRARYPVGRDARVMSRLARVMPDRVIDWLIARSLGLSRS
jgi:NAD(P)-dependent dehydrogenase (short-subunit alcohol dehydrogenase family)